MVFWLWRSLSSIFFQRFSLFMLICLEWEVACVPHYWIHRVCSAVWCWECWCGLCSCFFRQHLWYSWFEIPHKQFQLYLCGFFFLNPVPSWVPDAQVVRADFTLNVLVRERVSFPPHWKGCESAGLEKDMLRKKVNEMAYKRYMNSEIFNVSPTF